jgi:hypothetical protein
MERVYPWQQLLNNIAAVDALTEDSKLKMATELSRAIQTGDIQCWKEDGEPILGAVSFEMLRRLAPHLTVVEGNAWLKRNGYLHKWEPLESDTKPELVSTPLFAVPRIPVKRKKWSDVAWSYVVQVFSEGQYTTAKELYGALEKKSGDRTSPFDKGVGPSRGKLVVRDINQSVSLKTIQNCWADIQSAKK